MYVSARRTPSRGISAAGSTSPYGGKERSRTGRVEDERGKSLWGSVAGRYEPERASLGHLIARRVQRSPVLLIDGRRGGRHPNRHIRPGAARTVTGTRQTQRRSGIEGEAGFRLLTRPSDMIAARCRSSGRRQSIREQQGQDQPHAIPLQESRFGPVHCVEKSSESGATPRKSEEAQSRLE